MQGIEVMGSAAAPLELETGEREAGVTGTVGGTVLWDWVKRAEWGSVNTAEWRSDESTR